MHEISHWPDKHLGIQHLVPDPRDHEMLLWLNLLKTHCREVEIIALHAFGSIDIGGAGVGSSLAHALNRFSSATYVLELYFLAGRFTGE